MRLGAWSIIEIGRDTADADVFSLRTLTPAAAEAEAIMATNELTWTGKHLEQVKITCQCEMNQYRFGYWNTQLSNRERDESMDDQNQI